MEYPDHMWGAVESLIGSGKKAVISIDGPAGSGKTTLSRALENYLTGKSVTCQTIHMDDLYNGWDDALTEALAKKLSLLIASHEEGSSLTFSRYDWHAAHCLDPVSLPPSRILILEGVGSSPRAIRDRISLSIWIECASDIGLERVLKREPLIDHGRMKQWQLREREYFAGDESKIAANIKLSN